MTYTPRPYAEIKAARRAAIQSGAPMIPKGRCHMCDRGIAPKELWCSSRCAMDFAEERKELAEEMKKSRYSSGIFSFLEKLRTWSAERCHE